jgi:hypothetical protein
MRQWRQRAIAVSLWIASEQGLSSSVQTQRWEASWGTSKQDKGEEKGGYQAREQGRSKLERSQRELEAGNGPAWDQDVAAGEDPGRSDFFFQFWTRREGAVTWPFQPLPWLGTNVGKRQWMANS